MPPIENGRRRPKQIAHLPKEAERPASQQRINQQQRQALTQRVLRDTGKKAPNDSILFGTPLKLLLQIIFTIFAINYIKKRLL